MNEVRTVRIKGISALLMHKFPMIPIEAIEKKSAEEQAEFAAYRHPDTGELCIPGICVQRCLIQAATYSKGKNRASLQKPTAACIMVEPEYLPLGCRQYDIDSRPVVIGPTRGRIIRHRPRLNDWEVSFMLSWDPILLKEQEVRKIVDDGGTRVGLLDFRPERKGPFGRFMVITWK
jgi:hypothetical protein